MIPVYILIFVAKISTGKRKRLRENFNKSGTAEVPTVGKPILDCFAGGAPLFVVLQNHVDCLDRRKTFCKILNRETDTRDIFIVTGEMQ